MPLTAAIRLREVALEGAPMDKSTKAEPNLWTVFFAFDAAAIDLAPGAGLTIAGRPTVKASVGTHGSLAKQTVRRDGSATVPASVGLFETPLVPFELPSPSGAGVLPPLDDDTDGPLGDVLDDLAGDAGDLLVARRSRRAAAPAPRTATPRLGLPLPLVPAFGVVYVLLEWDWSQERTVESAHGAFNAAIRRRLDDVVARVGARGIDLLDPTAAEREAFAQEVRTQVLAAARSEAIAAFDVGSAVDADDLLGVGGQVFTPLGLTGERHFTERFETDGHGTWTIHGTAAVA